ncbi:hypothetical protein Bca52824_033886 [Brassica carinata]|uniref:Uncharacterized protein n=1 Tax=Brassica carinata TaxID=52824 RepID=A0A8X7V6H8_BRACI|nr:hypothetical protein Bca52824_033886 [Brassica carinata]
MGIRPMGIINNNGMQHQMQQPETSLGGSGANDWSLAKLGRVVPVLGVHDSLDFPVTQLRIFTALLDVIVSCENYNLSLFNFTPADAQICSWLQQF